MERYQRLLYSIAYRMLGDSGDAEDAAIVSFERFLRSPGSYRGDCSLKAYLCRICLNHCSTIRSQNRRRRAVPPVPPAAEEGPLEEILCAMSQLRDEDREVLTLYYLQELEYEEIGAALGIGYDALRTRLVRARSRLRQALGVNPEGER